MILPLKRRESKYSPVVVSDNFSVQLNLNEGFTTTKNEQTELLLVTTERQNDVGWVRVQEDWRLQNSHQSMKVFKSCNQRSPLRTILPDFWQKLECQDC